MPTMAREAWTDERLDDLKEHMDEGFRELRADIRSLRGETGQVRTEIGEMNAKFDALNRTLQIGFGLTGTFLVALVGLIGTQL
jgi:hypothetical protein